MGKEQRPLAQRPRSTGHRVESSHHPRDQVHSSCSPAAEHAAVQSKQNHQRIFWGRSQTNRGSAPTTWRRRADLRCTSAGGTRPPGPGTVSRGGAAQWLLLQPASAGLGGKIAVRLDESRAPPGLTRRSRNGWARPAAARALSLARFLSVPGNPRSYCHLFQCASLSCSAQLSRPSLQISSFSVAHFHPLGIPLPVPPGSSSTPSVLRWR
jgi:hypothetical protein